MDLPGWIPGSWVDGSWVDGVWGLSTPAPDTSPAPYTRNMNQFATYWPPAANDGFGMMEFGDPVLISCRWQDTQVLFRDSRGREVTSSSIVYPDRRLAIRGYLALGDLTSLGTDPRLSNEAMEIRQIGSSPSLSAAQVLYKAYL